MILVSLNNGNIKIIVVSQMVSGDSYLSNVTNHLVIGDIIMESNDQRDHKHHQITCRHANIDHAGHEIQYIFIALVNLFRKKTCQNCTN